MKIPSLTKLPNHRRFHIEPRYYDPVKEDIEERTSRIEQEIRQVGAVSGSHRSIMEGAFARRNEQVKNTNILQLSIIAILFTTIFGYIYYGNAVFYLFILAAPFYFLIRLRKFSGGRHSNGRHSDNQPVGDGESNGRLFKSN